MIRLPMFCLALALAVACNPVRNGIMAVTPGVPSRSDSDAAVGASRCNGQVPEVRSASGRWWSATPATAPCPYGCVESPEGAYCAAMDGGAQ